MLKIRKSHKHQEIFESPDLYNKNEAFVLRCLSWDSVYGRHLPYIYDVGMVAKKNTMANALKFHSIEELQNSNHPDYLKEDCYAMQIVKDDHLQHQHEVYSYVGHLITQRRFEGHLPYPVVVPYVVVNQYNLPNRVTRYIIQVGMQDWIAGGSANWFCYFDMPTLKGECSPCRIEDAERCKRVWAGVPYDIILKYEKRINEYLYKHKISKVRFNEPGQTFENEPLISNL
jgi:hypothetical protein